VVSSGLHGIDLRVPVLIRSGVGDFKELPVAVDRDMLRDPEVPGLVDPVVNVLLARLNLVDDGDVILPLQVVVGTVDDDLITALKSDAKKKKFVEDVSLVRELKGEKFDAKGLAAELEEILAAMRSQR